MWTADATSRVAASFRHELACHELAQKPSKNPKHAWNDVIILLSLCAYRRSTHVHWISVLWHWISEALFGQGNHSIPSLQIHVRGKARVTMMNFCIAKAWATEQYGGVSPKLQHTFNFDSLRRMLRTTSTSRYSRPPIRTQHWTAALFVQLYHFFTPSIWALTAKLRHVAKSWRECASTTALTEK